MIIDYMIITSVSGRLLLEDVQNTLSELEKFRPEQWCRESKELPNPFMSLPFGFGRRMCVGKKTWKDAPTKQPACDYIKTIPYFQP